MVALTCSCDKCQTCVPYLFDLRRPSDIWTFRPYQHNLNTTTVSIHMHRRTVLTFHGKTLHSQVHWRASKRTDIYIIMHGCHNKLVKLMYSQSQQFEHWLIGDETRISPNTVTTAMVVNSFIVSAQRQVVLKWFSPSIATNCQWLATRVSSFTIFVSVMWFNDLMNTVTVTCLPVS